VAAAVAKEEEAAAPKKAAAVAAAVEVAVAAKAAAVEDARDKQTANGGRSYEKKIKHHEFFENSRFCDPYFGLRSSRFALSSSC
jgi:hypothetical protein